MEQESGIYFDSSRTQASPVPELSFLPAPYRDWTRAGERRVQDNLHAHAQNAAIFSPQIGGKTIFGSIFQIWLVARFSEWLIYKQQFLYSDWLKTCQLIPNQWNFTSTTLNHIRFGFYHNIKDNERNLCQDLLTIENTDSDLKVHALHYANELLVRVRLSIQKLLQNHSTYRNNTKTMFGKRVMTLTRCR